MTMWSEPVINVTADYNDDFTDNETLADSTTVTDNPPNRFTTVFCDIKEPYVVGFYIYVYVIGPICLIGCFLNTLTILALGRKSSCSMYVLKLLAYCDISFLLVCFVLFTVRHLYVLATEGDYLFKRGDVSQGVEIQLVMDGLYYVVLFIRTWCVFLVTFHRCLVIVMPLRSRTLVTKCRLTGCFVFIVVIGFAHRIQPFVTRSLAPAWNECTGVWGQKIVNSAGNIPGRPFKYFNNAFFIFGTTIIPQLLMYVLNIVLLVSLQRSMKKSREMKSELKDKQAKSQNQATLMVVTMLAAYTICEFLGLVHVCMKMNRSIMGIKVVQWDEVKQYIRKAALILTVLNSSVNFFCYALSNRSFRQSTIELFRGKKKAKQLATFSSISKCKAKILEKKNSDSSMKNSDSSVKTDETLETSNTNSN